MYYILYLYIGVYVEIDIRMFLFFLVKCFYKLPYDLGISHSPLPPKKNRKLFEATVELVVLPSGLGSSHPKRFPRWTQGEEVSGRDE